MLCLSDELSFFFFLGDMEAVRNILCIVRLSTLCWIEEEKLRTTLLVVRVPFSQRLGTSTCVVLLIRCAVLPMAVIHKHTLFLYTSFKPPYMMRLLLLFFFFFPSKLKRVVFFLSNISLLFGSMPGSSQGAWKEREKFRIISFCSSLIHE